MTAADKNVEGFRQDLLRWYDKHRRDLPWRAQPGRTPNPYHVWLSEIMLQQTTVPAVIPYFQKFTAKWPGVENLAAAPADEVMQDWAGLGYYARARNLHKCAKFIVSAYGGVFPETADELKKLPGIGDYTSAAITAIAFGRPANVVDGNVERVMARIYAVKEPVPDSKPHLKSLAAVTAKGENARPGDYAQALMDLGATICTPSSPKCMICPVREHCSARAVGIEASLPARKAKGEKPQRHGYIYWIADGRGNVLFERRGEKGLLAGTIGLPTSAWVDRAIEKTHLPLSVEAWQVTGVKILHSFTHFDLELTGITAQAPPGKMAGNGDFFWVPARDSAKLGVPTLFRKALKQFI